MHDDIHGYQQTWMTHTQNFSFTLNAHNANSPNAHTHTHTHTIVPHSPLHTLPSQLSNRSGLIPFQHPSAHQHWSRRHGSQWNAACSSLRLIFKRIRMSSEYTKWAIKSSLTPSDKLWWQQQHADLWFVLKASVVVPVPPILSYLTQQ